jgi:hypothetical protein
MMIRPLGSNAIAVRHAPTEAGPAGRAQVGDVCVRPRRAQAARDDGSPPCRAGPPLVPFCDGNVGYLDLRGVTSPDIGWQAIAAAMQLVTHTDALIIDLRKNRGGDQTGYSCGTATSSPTPEPTSTASSTLRPSRPANTGPWRT